MTAKTFHGFLVRILALALALVGAVLLSAGLVGNAEAEITVTVHADTRVVHQPDTRSPPPTFGDIIMEAFDMTTIYNAMVACMEEEERAGETRILDSGLNCIPLRSSAPPEFLDGENGEYPADLCARLGGDVEYVRGQGVCQNIDTSGTFCFMGAPEVFPCRGLYKSVTHCNHFNRPGKNPFACGRNCPKGQFACGSKCWSGEISSTGRIPYVVPRHGSFYGYVGDVFRVAATLRAGEARFSLSSSIFTVGAADGTLATVGISAPLAAGTEYAATLRADFACNGLSNTPAHAEWAFTVTALAAVQPATVYLEGGEGTGVGTVTISGIGQLSFAESSPENLVLGIKSNGEISVEDSRPAIGTDRTFRVESTSPEFVGTITLSVVVKFRHPFDSDLGASHCRVPADYHELRRTACPNVAVDDYCRTLDAPLFNALGYPDGISTDSAFCRALRGGAEVNMWRGWRHLPRGESPLGVAAAENRVDIGRILTLSGALLDGPADASHTPLHEAARYGAVEFGEWLLTNGADINRKAISGSVVTLLLSPIHFMAHRREIDQGDSAGFAKLLINNNADPNEFVRRRFVYSTGQTSTITLTLRYINLLTENLMERAGFAPDHRPLTVLLDAGLDANHQAWGFLPLTRAIQHNYLLVASVMLEGGTGGKGKADPNLLNSYDQTTPLFYATSPEAVNLLEGAGANLNISVDIGGTVQTALDSMVSDFVQSVAVFHQNTILYLEPQLLDELEDQFPVLKRLGDLGGDCLAAPANSSRKALCTVVDGSTTGGADIGETASCDDLWTLNLGENELYMSSCHLECSTAGQSSEEWHCAELGDIYDDSGALDSSLVDAARSECETRAASSESGLSCQ